MNSEWTQRELIQSLFLESGVGDKKRFVLNELLPLNFSSEQEAAQFLVETIREWRSRGLFLNEVRTDDDSDPCAIPEDKLETNFRMFRGEAAKPYFVPVVELIEKILPKFTSYPFVEKKVICNCGCGHYSYSYHFRDLKILAEKGLKGVEEAELKKKEDVRNERLRNDQERLKEKGVRALEMDAVVKFEYADRYGGRRVEQALRSDGVVALFFIRWNTSTIDGTATWHGIAVIKDGKIEERDWMVYDYPDDRGSDFEQREKGIRELLSVEVTGESVSVEVEGFSDKRKELFFKK